MVSDRIMAPSSVFTTKQISILKSAKSLGIIRKSQCPKTKSNDPKLLNGAANASKLIPKAGIPDHSKSKTVSNNAGKVNNPPGSMQKVKIVQMPPSKDFDSLTIIAKKGNKQDTHDQIKTYLCKFCCRKFPNAELLDIHQKSHGPNPVHACHLCGIVTSNFSSLMAHYVRHSSAKSSNVIKKWTKAHANQGNVLKIPSRAEANSKAVPKPENSVSCTQCKRTFHKKEAFNSHYCPTVNRKTEFVCTYCRKITTTVEEYRDHIQSHSLPQFICSSCGIQFAKKSQLNEHVNVCPKKKLKITKKNSSISSPKNRKRTKLVKTPEKSKLSPTPTNSKCNIAINKLFSENEGKCVQNVPETPDTIPTEEAKDLTTSNEENLSSIEKPVKKRKRRKRKSVDLLDIEVLESEPISKRTLRTARSQPRYVSDLNSTYQPTRRSARLGCRKKISFSDGGDYSEIEATLEESNVEDYSQDSQEEICAPAEENIPAPPEENIESAEIEKSEELHITSTEDFVKPEVVENVITESLENTIINEEEDITSKAEEVHTKKKTRVQSKPTALYCQVCSLLFRSLGSLRRHKKMHTGKPQFVCNFCGKFFFRRDIHLRHENSVHQNSAEKGFLCYYCKEKFETSEHLKDHSTQAHVAKALTPERIRRCTGVSKTKKPRKYVPKKIKAEPLEKNCTSKTNNLNVKCKSENTLPDLCELVDKVFDHDELSNSKLRISQPEELCKKNSSEVLNISEKAVESVDSEDILSNTDVSLNICTNEFAKDVKNEDDTAVDEELPSVCDLCSKELSDESKSTCCHDSTFRVVDWFQCLVCAYSGTKSQIQDHMISHTYKVGTVVVHDDDEQYNHVRTYLPLFADILDLPEEYEELESIRADTSKEDTLQENDSSTLMESVKCRKCQEVIVDIEFLIHHSCIENDDSNIYSCFVEKCKYVTDDKSSLQCHLGRRHYTSLVASAFSQVNKVSNKCSNNQPMPFINCDSQIENIFLASTEDDTFLLTDESTSTQ